MLIKPNSPFYKNPTLWLVVLLPLTTVIVGIAFVIFSIISYDGVVEDDYYKKGKQINRAIERDEVANHYGLSTNIEIDNEKKILSLRLDAQQQIEFPEQLKLKFIHRTVSDQDIELQVVRNSVNDYLAVWPGLPEGLWRIELSTPKWRLRGKISYPDQNQIILLTRDKN